MKIDFVGLAEYLDIKSNSRGWYSSESLVCPECGKAGGKFGILPIKDAGLVSCWKCGYKDSLYNYLKKVDLLEYVSSSKKYELSNKLESIDFRPQTKVMDIKVETLPKGFKLIEQDDYLDSRNFLAWHYKAFSPGYTNHYAESKWRNKIIFQIFNNGKLVGLLGRSRKSKIWHDKNLEDYHNGKANLDLRYRNSDTDFSTILGGLDDITENTIMIIIVEGLFDKVNVDKLLDIQNNKFLAVIFTFGSNISKAQIELLKTAKNKFKLKNLSLVIMYDNDAIKKVKKLMNNLIANFEDIKIATLKDKDPGEINSGELLGIMNELKTPQELLLNTLI